MSSIPQFTARVSSTLSPAPCCAVGWGSWGLGYGWNIPRAAWELGVCPVPTQVSGPSSVDTVPWQCHSRPLAHGSGTSHRTSGQLCGTGLIPG